MMKKEEKVLLDQLFTSAQNIVDFMRRNGYNGTTSINVRVDKDSDKYDSISVNGVEFYASCNVKRLFYKELGVLDDEPKYREIKYKDVDDE